MKVLITGGNGFIGSHVVDRFLDKGHSVVIVDDFSSSDRAYQRGDVSFHECDITSDKLESVFENEKPEIVCHLAAKTNLRESLSDPFSDIQGNIVGLVNVCEMSVKYGVKQFVFSCTGGALYGNTDQLPVPETAPTNPISPYGISKLAGEKYLYYYNRVHNLSVTILRYSNVYGPRNERKSHSGAVTTFIQKALTGDDITVFGDGNQTRDFVYVKDIARANYLAASREDSGYLVINTSGGSETSLNDFMKELESAIGSQLKITNGPENKGEVRRSFLDISKAKETIGWSPEYDLRQGLKETIAHLKSL